MLFIGLSTSCGRIKRPSRLMGVCLGNKLAVLLTHPSMHNPLGCNKLQNMRPLFMEKGSFLPCKVLYRY